MHFIGVGILVGIGLMLAPLVLAVGSSIAMFVVRVFGTAGRLK
jgi:hypothetical protein